MAIPVRPPRGGFLRPFGCGWFIREFLSGRGPHGSPVIDPATGAPQADIFREYKEARRRVTALDGASAAEEKKARREKRPISPDNIETLSREYLARIPYKAQGCRYHSFVVYVAMLRQLGWVEPTGQEEPSSFQGNYPKGQPRRYFRLTGKGRQASDMAWANPHLALYGKQ